MPKPLVPEEVPVDTLEAKILAPAEIPFLTGMLRPTIKIKIWPWTTVTSSAKKTVIKITKTGMMTVEAIANAIAEEEATPVSQVMTQGTTTAVIGTTETFVEVAVVVEATVVEMR